MMVRRIAAVDTVQVHTAGDEQKPHEAAVNYRIEVRHIAAVDEQAAADYGTEVRRIAAADYSVEAQRIAVVDAVTVELHTAAAAGNDPAAEKLHIAAGLSVAAVPCTVVGTLEQPADYGHGCEHVGQSSG